MWLDTCMCAQVDSVSNTSAHTPQTISISIEISNPSFYGAVVDYQNLTFTPPT